MESLYFSTMCQHSVDNISLIMFLHFLLCHWGGGYIWPEYFSLQMLSFLCVLLPSDSYMLSSFCNM